MLSFFLPSCIPPSIVSHSSVLPQNLAPLLSLAPSINSLSALVLLFILLDIKFTNVILVLERTKTMYMQTIKFDIKKSLQCSEKLYERRQWYYCFSLIQILCMSVNVRGLFYEVVVRGREIYCLRSTL